jgi:hypothetical protein
MTDTAFGTLADLDEASDVAVSRPRLPLVLGGLVVVGVLVSILVVFVVAAITTAVHPDSRSGADVGLATVEQRVGIDLPDGTVVLATSGDDSFFSAELVLPDGQLPDFPLAGYGEAAGPSDELAAALGDEPVTEYLAASATGITGSAAIVERGGAAVLFVDVRTEG